MFKTKMVKAVMLGLCLSAMTAGSAWASTTAVSLPVKGEALSEDTKALYAKQKEIDLYVFADHVDEIAAKGFEINYTGVSDTYVEIGIAPYTDKNANYLYDLFGKDIVKVVEAQDNTLYTITAETAAADGNSSSEAATSDIAASTEAVSGESSGNEGTTDAEVKKDVADTQAAATAPDEKVYKGAASTQSDSDDKVKNTDRKLER
jgi:hypothetical protein